MQFLLDIETLRLMKNKVEGVFWFDRSFQQKNTSWQLKSLMNHICTLIIAVLNE